MMQFKFNYPRKAICALLCLFFIQEVISQSSAIQLEKITPPSPEAAALAKYGAFSVGMFTGTPNITIDIYKLQPKLLGVPVFLNYSANGMRVDEMPTKVGMSWALHAGGAITRTVYDKPDDTYIRAGAPPSTDFSSTTSTDYSSLPAWLDNIDVNHLDTQFDEYDYSFNGISGKFIVNSSGVPVQIPYNNIKIEMSPLRITTADGIQYYFGENGATESSQLSSGSCSREDSRGAKNAWYLTRIINPNDPSENITFTYINGGYTYIANQNHTITFWNSSNTCNGAGGSSDPCGCGPTPCIYGGNGSPGIGVDNFCANTQSVSVPYISEITSSLYGKIKFLYTGYASSGTPIATDRLLTSIQIFQNSNGTGLLKSFSLNYSFAKPVTAGKIISLDNIATQSPDVNIYRPFLSSLQELTSSGLLVKTHSFEYNDINNLTARLSSSQDYWGYFNGKINGTSFIPGGGPGFPTSKIADRNPDYVYSAKGILTKVNFPTGGYVQFTYEPNSTNPNPPPTSPPTTASLAYSGPGMRVAQQSVFDPVTQQTTTTNYQYSGMIIPYSPIYTSGLSYKHEQYLWIPGNNACSSGPNPCAPLKTCSYLQYSSYSAINTNGRGGSPIYYTSVTESTGSNFVLGGTEHTYSYFVDAPLNILRGTVILNSTAPSSGWKNGQETNTNTFKMVGATKVYLKKITNTYTDDASINNSYTQYALRKSGVCETTSPSGSCTANSVFNLRMDCWDIMSYAITQKWTYLSSKQVVDYDMDGNNPVTTTTNYYYDNSLHTNLTRIESVNSKGQAVKQVMKYPGDEATITNLTTSESDAITKLKTRNNYTPLLESDQYVNTIFQSRVHNGYKDWGSLILKPDVVKSQTLTNSIDSRIQFTQYDANGNLLAQSKTGDALNSFIWDYKNTQPIAEVMNAGQPDIAYTSFEGDGKGNWAYTGNTYLDPTAPTGRRCYTLGNSITKSGLSTTTTYIVSYWKKSGTVAVNSTTPTTGRSVNGWTYYEHKVVNPAGGTITVSGTSGIIDELRLYPASNVQVNTYTYDPLVGVTSKCDANNRIIYYEYDGLQRLMLIRDQDKNILKQFYYNYAGQAENTSIYYNQAQSGIYYKTGCTGCLTGSGVTYTVPANTYSAATLPDANQLALNDINVNGQAYADASGTCTTPANATVSGSNANSVSFTFTFHNNCTGTNYSFSLSANQTTLINLGSLQSNSPGATYNVTFNPPSSSSQFTFRVNTTYTLHANSGTIFNVPVGTGGAIVNITP